MKRTALYDEHIKQNGRMVNFGGWELPIQFSSILAEHKAVRENVGVFDASHMGEFFVEGKDTKKFINYAITNNLNKIKHNKCIYSPLLYENGTFVDDLIVYLFDETKAMIVVNASNIQKDFDWLSSIINNKNFDVSLSNQSDSYSLIAIQGTKSQDLINQLFPNQLTKMDSFSFKEISYHNTSIIVSTTGYTGEKGIEIYVKNNNALELYRQVLELGAIPCGLGARDSLRLEKGYSLYGHEITDKTNALEAGLGWTIDFSKEDFIGKDALLKIKKEGIKKKLKGAIMIDRGIPRENFLVFDENSNNKIGHVTSGTFSPSLKKNIALVYIPSDYNKNNVKIQIRDKFLMAKLQKRTFL